MSNMPNNYKDLRGLRFGKLVAVQPTEKRNVSRQVIWECLCECGNTVYVAGSALSSGNTKSCGCLQKAYAKQSIEQFNKTHHGTTHSRAKDGSIIRACGYRYIWAGDKREPEHRVIAQKALGRKLKRNEVVHHINGDKLDNRNCNLLICSVSYHKQLHDLMGFRYMREHFSKVD